MFRYVEVELVDDDFAEHLVSEYAKINDLAEKSGDEGHGHTIVAQIFAHKDNPRRFFLSGRVLSAEESAAFAAIVGVKEK